MAERKERGRERLGALPAVLQAKGFIEHNMPRIKGGETETQQPIRRQWRRQWRPGGWYGITAVTLSQTLSGGGKDTEKAGPERPIQRWRGGQEGQEGRGGGRNPLEGRSGDTKGQQAVGPAWGRGLVSALTYSRVPRRTL